MVSPLPFLLLLCPAMSVFAQSSVISSSNPASGSGSSVSGAPSSGSSTASVTGSNSLSATPTSSAAFPNLSGFSTCVDNCLTVTIGQLGCDSVVDVDCFCSNATSFVETLVGCVTPSCPGDLASAESVSQQFCNLASPSVSLSFSPLPTSNSVNSSPASSSIPSSSSLSSSSSGSVTSSVATTPTSSAASSSATSPAPSSSGSADQSSGASLTYDQMPRLSIVLTVGAGFLLSEAVLGF